jgi:SAM-dependent methyltransferase
VALRVLHVGCGNAPLPAWFSESDSPIVETLLDINPEMDVDIVASMTDMGEIGPFDVVYSCHCLEHLYPHDGDTALKECLRVLEPGGRAIMIVPDLGGVACDDTVVYESPSGPVTGRDMYYGHSGCVRNNPYMAHRNGFVEAGMRDILTRAGFSRVDVMRGGGWNLVGVGTK